VLYAKSWGSTRHYGDAAAEAALRAGLKDWCVDESWFAGAAPGCRFMHCLPVRRGVVVRDEVLDGPRSVVVRQAHNRMWVQMAVLHRLLAGRRAEGEVGAEGADGVEGDEGVEERKAGAGAAPAAVAGAAAAAPAAAAGGAAAAAAAGGGRAGGGAA
jgi:hypothetical protein